MNRLLTGLCALALLVAGCGPAPITSPGLSNDSSARAQASALAKTAHEQLCNTKDPAGLSKLATQFDALDAKADTTQVQAALGALLVNLQHLHVDATTQPTRDAAGTAVLQLQNSLKSPTKREQAATNAASALRAVERAVCS